MPRLTLEQIAALAPDPASLKAGRGLAGVQKWQALGSDELALWGACKGSAAESYKVCVDLVKTGYTCTCPSRKFPCKHTLGLLLLAAASPAALQETVQPSWVADWLSKRAVRDEAATHNETGRQAQVKRSAGRQDDAARRAARREKLAREGIEAFELWLKDMVRSGLMTLPAKPASYWSEQAARLVDAQLPGAARLVRELAAMPMAAGDWAERFLIKLSRLYLLAQAYHKLDNLSAETQADVRALLGWTINQDDLRSSGEGVMDAWLVVSQRMEDEDASGVRTQVNWLWGRETKRAALILNFAHRSAPLDTSLPVGLAVQGEMVYYPGAFPLRAVWRAAQTPKAAFVPQGLAGFGPLLAAYSAALAKNPWLESFPVVVEGVRAQKLDERVILIDGEGRLLPVDRRFPASWGLVALSGGSPLTLFGCWDGFDLLPMSAWEGDRWVRFDERVA